MAWHSTSIDAVYDPGGWKKGAAKGILGGGGTTMYYTAKSLTLTVTMSEAIALDLTGGSPTLSLNDNATATFVSATSTTLTFSYTVASGENTSDLRVTAYNANGSQHLRKDLIAILQGLDAIAAYYRRAKQGTHLAPELRIFDAMTMLDLVPDLLLRRVQIQG